MNYPPVTIVIPSYFPEGAAGILRYNAAHDTIASWGKFLRYDGSIETIIVHDGPSEDENDLISQIYNFAVGVWGLKNVTGYYPMGRGGIGRSLNEGFKMAFRTSPIVLCMIDDWSLIEPLDISPWVQLLMEREDVGMVRLGPPHPGNVGHVEALTDNWQGWGLRLQTGGFAFGHRPALYHSRFIENHGWFEESMSALECERFYSNKWTLQGKRDIVLALPHKFWHIDSVELSSVDPKV